MKFAVVGARGMVGKEYCKLLAGEGRRLLTVGRRECDVNCDLTLDSEKAYNEIRRFEPDVVINCAAMLVQQCEIDTVGAWSVNVGIVQMLVNVCNDIDCKFVQVSTDHLFCGNGRSKNSETAEVTIVNEYARTKYEAEQQAATAKNNLILRTNVTGLSSGSNQTFFEWLYDSLAKGNEICLYDDYYTSTIDVGSFVGISERLIKEHVGLVNIGSSEVLSKYEFGLLLAKEMGVSTEAVKKGKVVGSGMKRAESLGLDSQKAEKLLGIQMPSSSDTCKRLLHLVR